MKHPLKYSILTALILICVYIAFLLHAYLFFTGELRKQGITESVRVGTQTYSVDKGVVHLGDKRIIGITALRALRIAYAKSLAERSPLLGLEGTDPKFLRANTTLLAKTMDRISQRQKESLDSKLMDTVLYPAGSSQQQIETGDSQLVRTSLYPIDFLYALANLETARKQFIASGSENDLHSYRGLFDVVIESGMHDSKKLLDAFMYKTFSKKTLRIPSFAGTATVPSTIESLQSISSALTTQKQRAIERDWCLSGMTWFCPFLSFPLLLATQFDDDTKRESLSQKVTRADIDSILRAVAATSTYDKIFAPVRLNKSSCLSSLPPPYSLVAARNVKVNFQLLTNLDNMYFIPTAGSSGPVPQFLRDTYGLSYIKVNPFTFYVCPHLLEDVSDAQATLRVASIARKYPEIDNSNNHVLLTGTPDDVSAKAYLTEAIHAARSEHLPEPYVQEILETALIFNQRSAGLEGIVGQIAYINAHDLETAISGAPFDVTADALFLTHMAIPSLFLFHQLGAVSLLATSTDTDMREFHNHFKPLSSVLNNITQDALISEMRRLNYIENK